VHDDAQEPGGRRLLPRENGSRDGVYEPVYWVDRYASL
jgi:hypothetical protein